MMFLTILFIMLIDLGRVIYRTSVMFYEALTRYLIFATYTPIILIPRIYIYFNAGTLDRILCRELLIFGLRVH